LILHIKSGMKY